MFSNNNYVVTLSIETYKLREILHEVKTWNLDLPFCSFNNLFYY
jgi:hypothetical protein